jgi:hypothetical protein
VRECENARVRGIQASVPAPTLRTIAHNTVEYGDAGESADLPFEDKGAHYDRSKEVSVGMD